MPYPFCKNINIHILKKSIQSIRYKQLANSGKSKNTKLKPKNGTILYFDISWEWDNALQTFTLYIWSFHTTTHLINLVTKNMKPLISWIRSFGAGIDLIVRCVSPAPSRTWRQLRKRARLGRLQARERIAWAKIKMFETIKQLIFFSILSIFQTFLSGTKKLYFLASLKSIRVWDIGL